MAPSLAPKGVREAGTRAAARFSQSKKGFSPSGFSPSAFPRPPRSAGGQLKDKKSMKERKMGVVA